MPDWYNPPFDMRMNTTPTAGSQPVQKGYMVTAETTLPGDSQNKGIRFLFNPSTISLDYQATDSLIDAANRPGDGAVVNPNVGTCNFELLFDRTYELWTRNGGLIQYNADNMANPLDTPELASWIGVLADINAFRLLTGILPDAEVGLNTTADVGPMLWQPWWVYLTGGGQGDLQSLALHLYGYITNLSIQITHWTWDMIPARAVVGLTMSLSTKDPAATMLAADAEAAGIEGGGTAPPGALEDAGPPGATVGRSGR